MLRRRLLPLYARLKQPGFIELLESLQTSQYFAREELTELQEAKLRAVVSFAYAKVPYYRQLFVGWGLRPSDISSIADLQKLPLLTKNELKNQFESLLSREPGLSVSTRRTSGSTGSPYKIVVDGNATLLEAAAFYRFLFSAGYEWGDPTINLWGGAIVSPDGNRAASAFRKHVSAFVWNRRLFDTYKVDSAMLDAIVVAMMQRPNSIVRGYVSSVYTIAREAMERGISLPAKAVTTTAEKLFDYQRATIEKAFQKKVFDQYGCGECNSVAFECEQHDGLHVASERVVVELLDDEGAPVIDGAPGRVIITDLVNHAMPLIRYDTGDLASWSRRGCACGRGLPVLKRIEGRAYEMLDVPGGRKIHGGFFDEVYIEMRLGDKYSIADLRVVQEDLYNYRLEFVMDRELDNADVAALKKKYRDYLGDVTLKIKYLATIPATKTGKRMFVIPYRSG